MGSLFDDYDPEPPAPPTLASAPPPRADDGFEEFWKLYPRKTAKPAALRSWKALKAGKALRAAILADVERRKRSRDWMKEGGKYRPYPATYLNQRRWEDEPEEDGLYEGLKQFLENGDA